MNTTTYDNPQINIFGKVPPLPDHKHLLGFMTRIHTSNILEVHYYISNFKITITFPQFLEIKCFKLIP